MCGENRGGGRRWWRWLGGLFFRCFAVWSCHGCKKNQNIAGRSRPMSHSHISVPESGGLLKVSFVFSRHIEKIRKCAAARTRPSTPSLQGVNWKKGIHISARRWPRYIWKNSRFKSISVGIPCGFWLWSNCFDLERAFFFFLICNYWKPNISPTTADYFTPVKF